MTRAVQVSVRKLVAASLLAFAIAPKVRAGESGLERVRIAVSSKSLGFLDTWAAKERGFYRKQGIDAEIIAMRPPLTIGAIQAGEIDYAFGASTISRGSISGAPVRLVSLALRTSFHTLVARPQVKSIADLKRKTIAVTIGAADDFVARHLIRRAGHDPRDFAFVNMGGSDSRFPALHAGSIDATPLSLPFFLIAKHQGFTILGSAADVLDMATVGIGTSTSKIKQEREQVKKMVRAQLDTLRWINSQKSEVVPFLQKFFGLPEDVAVESHAIYAKLLIEDARPLATAVKTILDQQGKPDFPLDRVVDATIVEEVLRERR
ncbi:MAG TPA: ABC transporter substrate-binding protein [Candidatus Binatia bacterium]|nr:ABC transporter substrate-binding protein [Candidatus Binatia bacterium]